MGPNEVFQNLLYNKDTTEGGISLLQVRETGKKMQRRRIKPHRLLFWGIKVSSFSYSFCPCSTLLFFSSALLPWCFPSFSFLILLLMTSPCLPFLSYFFPCSQKPQQNLSNIIKIIMWSHSVFFKWLISMSISKKQCFPFPFHG